MAASELTAAQRARYVQWQADTRARGGTPTRFPDGKYRGELAERYNAKKPYRYVLAPAQIIADDRGIAVSLVLDQLKGKAADVVTGTISTIKSAAQTVASAPRTAIGTALGVPKWAVTALLIAGVAFVAYRLTSSPVRSR